MRARLEHLDLPPEASFRCFEQAGADQFPRHWHHHPEWQLTLGLGGGGRRLIGRHAGAWGPGDLVLVAPGQPHTWIGDPADGAHRVVTVQFAPERIALLALPEAQPIRDLLTRARGGLAASPATTRSAARLMRAMPAQRPLARLAALIELLRLLADDAAAQPIEIDPRGAAISAAGGERIAQVCRWLATQAHRPIPARAAARVAGMHPAAFSRFFRRLTSRTFTAYVRELRVARACGLLAQGRRPIAEIAAACGFASPSTFDRAFRQARGLAPRAYRRLAQDIDRSP
ncbi:MAG TPA: AraC family transcriptional regulator [Planctomycetota bacterium]|nr:AraC family transcriptional regulator [Planctomycetota bacterium]